MAAHEQHAQLVVLQRGAFEVEVELVVAHVLHQIGGAGGGDAVVAQAVERLRQAVVVSHAPGGPARRGDPLDRRGNNTSWTTSSAGVRSPPSR